MTALVWKDLQHHARQWLWSLLVATTGGIYAELLALQGSTRKADKAKLLRYDITH